MGSHDIRGVKRRRRRDSIRSWKTERDRHAAAPRKDYLHETVKTSAIAPARSADDRGLLGRHPPGWPWYLWHVRAAPRQPANPDETGSVGPTAEQKTLAFVVTVPGHTFVRTLPANGTVRIGRAQECEIAIEDHAISRVHARVHPDRGVT
jgi:hypothetical protein